MNSKVTWQLSSKVFFPHQSPLLFTRILKIALRFNGFIWKNHFIKLKKPKFLLLSSFVFFCTYGQQHAPLPPPRRNWSFSKTVKDITSNPQNFYAKQKMADTRFFPPAHLHIQWHQHWAFSCPTPTPGWDKKLVCTNIESTFTMSASLHLILVLCSLFE